MKIKLVNEHVVKRIVSVLGVSKVPKVSKKRCGFDAVLLQIRFIRMAVARVCLVLSRHLRTRVAATFWTAGCLRALGTWADTTNESPPRHIAKRRQT